VVDDDHDVRAALVDALTFAGYEVDVAASGDEALRALEEGDRPSLILLDLVMPEVDGWTVSSTIKTEDGRRDIPVIVMTAHGEPMLRRAPVSAGYLLKKSISVGGTLQHVNTIDGIDWFTDDLAGNEELFHDHDVAAKAKYWRAGASLSFSLGRGVGLGISYLGTLSGENTHSGRSITVTPTWSFGAPRSR